MVTGGLRVALAALGLSIGCTAAAASPVVDGVNGQLAPPFLVWGTDRAGWVFTPARSLLVDGLYSTFRNVGSASQSGPVLRRDVTLSIREGTAQGMELARAGFSADASAGDLGATFTPVLMVAGRPYFISYSGLSNLGLNIVDWNITAPEPQQPAGTVNLDGWYHGPAFETHVPQRVNGVLQVFSAPILRLQGRMATGLDSADCVMRWAEGQYPGLLSPAPQRSAVLQGYYYRHYAASNTYVGLDAATGHMLLLDAGGVLTDLGPLQGWAQTAGCPPPG